MYVGNANSPKALLPGPGPRPKALILLLLPQLQACLLPSTQCSFWHSCGQSNTDMQRPHTGKTPPDELTPAQRAEVERAMAENEAAGQGGRGPLQGMRSWR